MRKPDLSAATEVAVVVTVAPAQREVQPAVTDSQVRMVSRRVFLNININIFLLILNRIFFNNI